ncbi:hypothetical protein [Paraburkholderia domus]|jgi:hypothetical protein|uniref:hypothetical protein n=1 Tax=Paraburkholderia domus TaxID=2793075 RepID=UPI0019126208|nr:hypothetical protein [Paraburkholderia domus]MBK5065675.1 hypothetical protein [Burkholderia sp. R-70199]CAE6960895.1 hypothetical protein R70199_07312 [Paraburkholderia domus]
MEGVRRHLNALPDRRSQQELVLPGSVVADDPKRVCKFRDDDTINIQTVSPADLAASRTWIDNWKRMLPCIVVT